MAWSTASLLCDRVFSLSSKVSGYLRHGFGTFGHNLNRGQHDLPNVACHFYHVADQIKKSHFTLQRFNQAARPAGPVKVSPVVKVSGVSAADRYTDLNSALPRISLQWSSLRHRVLFPVPMLGHVLPQIPLDG